MSSKQLERAEKKKRKLAALAKVVELNDKDRLATGKNEHNSDDVELKTTKSTLRKVDRDHLIKANEDVHPPKKMLVPTMEETDDRSFIEVTYKKNSYKRKKGSTSSCSESDTLEEKKSHDEIARKRLKKDQDALDTETDKMDIPRALTEDEYADLRRKLKERKRLLQDVPFLQLLETGQRALLQNPQDKRTPMFLTDIQHLLMTALLGMKSPCPPDRWCLLQKCSKLSHSLVLIVEGMSLYHYLSNENKFEEANKIFETRLEILLPPQKEGLMMYKLAQVPLTNMQANKLIRKYGSLESAIALNQDPTLFVDNMFPVELQKSSGEKNDDGTSSLPPNDKFPRTKLLLSALQMVDEGYPMPLSGEMMNLLKDYVFTKKKYEPVNDHSPMFGVDCEMCTTTAGINELTRISIVNEKHEVVYESLVRPPNKIVNYLTQFSGITPELMATVTKDIKEVQKDVSELLPPDAILVGQSLQFDLHAMHMMHPYVIDSSVCFNLSGKRKLKSKLAKLSKAFLDEAIQESTEGHDSIEDSLASLKLVQKKLANSFEFGDVILEEKRRIQMVLNSDDCALKNNMIAHASKRDKTTAIVTNGELESPIKQIINQATEAGEDKLKSVNIFEMETNKKVVKKAREVALEHALTITNIKIEEQHTTLDSLDSTIEKLDKWIDKLWKTVAHNGLFLVLMGGAKDCPNGVAKIAIKKNVADVAAEIPVTV